MTNPYPCVKDFFLLGKTLKSHGTGGQLRMAAEDKFKSYFSPGAFVFFDLNGSKVPFRISDIDDDVHFVVSFEDVHAKDQSDALTNKDCWIPIEQVKSRHLKSPRHLKEEWDSYVIEDTISGSTYIILRTEEFPQQLMAIIELNGKEVYIPLTDQLIESIDRENRIIAMRFPEGLLEL